VQTDNVFMRAIVMEPFKKASKNFIL